MKVLFYSTKPFEQKYYLETSIAGTEIDFTAEALSPGSVSLAGGYEGISVFTNDDVSAPVIGQLNALGIKYISTRATGVDNIDLTAAKENNISIANVPGYSPYAIAEHAVAMMLTLNRKLLITDRQVHQHNFTLDNLVGFDMHNKTVGIVGTGTIGEIVADILNGFGCRLLVCDLVESPSLVKKSIAQYVSLEELCSGADIITLHIPLNQSTRYLFNKDRFAQMKKGVMIINTARGGIVNSKDLLEFIDNGTIAACGLDVYENEKGIFFFDHSAGGITDEVLKTLLAKQNVLITPHQAFATNEALGNIADTTMQTFSHWAKKVNSPFEVILK